MARLPSKLLHLLAAAVLVLGALARPFTPEDLVETSRLSGPIAVSPDGARIAYKQTHYSIAKKRQFSRLLVQPLASPHEGAPTVMAEYAQDARPNPPAGQGSRGGMDASEPVWLSSDTLGFVTTDKDSHTSTLYSVRVSGKHRRKPRVVFTAPVPIADVQYNEQSGILAFTAQVYGNSTLEETARRDGEERERADTAMAFDELWVRHWDTFVTEKKPQIHTLKLVPKKHTFRPRGTPLNIIRGSKLEASSSFVFAPNGRQVAFVAKRPGTDYAWRTTSFVFVADVDGTAVTAINPEGGGASASPVFSADGKRIAYLQMDAPAYEADRNQIKLYSMDDQSTVSVAADWDRSPSQLLWADDHTLLATYNEYGRNKLAKIDIATGARTPLVSEHSVGSMQPLPAANEVVVSYSGFALPTDLFRVSAADGRMARITHMNPRLGADVDLSAPEDVEFVGADDAPIHGFILHPPGFDPKLKYPLAYVIHGGPQSSFTDSWSTRWNLNIFAAAGFVTVAMDFQGSTGYGQNFTDAIRNQWGGKPFESLMLSLEQLLDSRPYIDPSRLTALGASYGGYQINWINAHTTVFKALVNHDGMFSTVSTYYSTDELYFPETEFQGVPFDKQARENYEKWSPERNVHKWKTPTLVIHGERDYRLVVSEGLSTFTALRRQGVPARFLYYPDENHWVLKPANSLRWHHEVLDWITRWTPNVETTHDSRTNFVIQQ
ncbi:dipeptidylpeptidase [Coemansia sp. RSA 2336]|nr:dipeptidylpeptidase [Coemansia sp. RSA 2336]